MKKAGSIVILSGMSVMLIGCLVFLYLILGTDLFFKKGDNNTLNVDNIPGETIEMINGPAGDIKVAEMTAAYTGDKAFAGGRVTSDSFVVIIKDESGKEYELLNYKCSMLDNENYRLVEGSNTFVFYYNDMSATATVEAVNPESCGVYAPSYVLYTGNRKSSSDKIEAVKSGKMTLTEAVSDIAFTGDSQIAALVSYRLLTTNTVEALVGASADYLEEKFEAVVTKAYGKQALVVHYGINSLSSSAAEREYRINQYKDLLLRLKKELPGTRIIVSGVFPVSNTIQLVKPSFGYINNYDYELLKMCMEIDVEYYSNNEYMVAHQEYFSDDGLHLKPAFYSEYWLNDLIITMGL